MTKEITKAFILQEITKRFTLRDFEPEKFLFSETVVPIYNIDPHLGLYRISTKTQSVTGTGEVLFYTVPDNEEWVLNGYNVIFMASGAYTIAGVYITRRPIPTSFMYMDLTAAQTVSYAVNLPKPLRLKAGDTINVNVDGYTSIADLRVYIDVLKESVR